VDVYLELGSKRVFASAVEWPGWARIGKTEDEAIETLLAYGNRYASAIASARQGFKPPSSVRVVDKVKGDAGTDFGALSISPNADDRKLGAKELKRQVALLKASWATFDAMAKKYAKKTLRKGPRGGGRDLKKMTGHVLEADISYLSSVGARYKGSDMAEMREAFLRRLEAHARGEPIENKRRTPPWTVRYCVRRSAWHALDHAWEIEDRAT
jgi:hypothetical protein